MRVDFGPEWLGMEAVFGGSVLAAVVDTATLDGLHPQSLNAAFVSSVHPGRAEISTEVLHRGRSTASMRLALVQGDRLRVHASASLVPRDRELVWDPPTDPGPWGDPEASPPLVPRHRPLPYAEHLDLRRVGQDTLEDGATAWVRMRESDGLGPHGRAALLLDVLPPGLFAREPAPGFVPSIDFSVHFSPRAALAIDPGAWFLVNNRTVWSAVDYCVDQSVLHDRDGHLLAQVRQGRAVRW